MSENNVDMTQIVLGKFLITVDSKTAEQILNDKVFAQNYLDELNKIEANQQTAIASANPGNMEKNKGTTCSLPVDKEKGTQNKIWTTRVLTEIDKRATYYFLELRKKLNNKFADKFSPKNSLWLEIAQKLNEANFFVGDGIEGREKCRQKFANLQSSYMKYIDKRRSTGEGKLEKPPFFDEMDEILGAKDKAKPHFLIDSLKKKPFQESTNNVVDKSEIDELPKNDIQSKSSLSCTSTTNSCASPSTSYASTSNSTPSTSRMGSADRFKKSTKTITPNKHEILEKFYKLAEKSEQRQEHEFSSVLQLMREESDRRHKQMMSLISEFAKSSQKKRKRHDSSDESD